MVTAALPTISAHLIAAETDAWVKRAVAIDPDRSRLDALRHSHRSGPVASPNAAGKAEFRVVRQLERLSLVIERDHRNDRAENLLARDPHLVIGVREHRRFDKIACGQVPAETLAAE